MLLLLFRYVVYVFVFFFFQAEDGIRDLTVTGVQTCALPISTSPSGSSPTTTWRRSWTRPTNGSPSAAASRPVTGSPTARPARASRRQPREIGRASCRERV